jgi:hypothetical protein
MSASALRDQLFNLETSLARLSNPLQNRLLVALFNRCNRLRLRCTSAVLRLDAAEVNGTLPPVPVGLIEDLSATGGRVATVAARFDEASADGVLAESDRVLKRAERFLPPMP